jgi:RNA polymerase sigma-70 factor (ECF subfamily)
MEQPSDETLVQRVLAGDHDALSALVVRYHQPLLGYLYRLTEGNRPLAEDLVQETFARLLRPANFQPGRPFKPWLYAIATNLARDSFRSAEARRTTAVADGVLAERLDPAPSPEERAIAADEGRAVHTALRQLADEYRITIVLRFYQELRLEEVALALGVPLGTVKSRLSVGTRRLRHLLVSLREEVQQ